MHCSCVRQSDLPNTSRLFADVLYHPDRTASFYQHPFGLSPLEAGGLGFGLAIAIIIFEIRLKQASLTRLIGAAVGSILGILGAFLMSLVVGAGPFESSTKSFLQILPMLLMAYIGLIVGAAKGDMLNLDRNS